MQLNKPKTDDKAGTAADVSKLLWYSGLQF